MRHYLASAGDRLRTDWLKRFDARYWTVDFPRPMMAALTTPGDTTLVCDLAFLKADDLAGVIWESADRWSHPLTGYATDRDYRALTLSFRWRAEGDVLALDAVNGPVLTLEGRDAAGAPRTWYVRLWNYAVGTPADAVVRLDFDAMDGGFALPDEADRVWAGDLDRLFISLAPAGFTGADAPLAAEQSARVTLSDIACEGGRAVLDVGDAWLPPHGFRIAGGYDDSYNQTPARLLRAMAATGYRGLLDHYVGMSHFMALRWDAGAAKFLVRTDRALCGPCVAWHLEFLALARAMGFTPILSLSFELFDAHAPEAWKQRDHTGGPALTGYTPPSTLLSPVSAEAMAWLRGVAAAFVALDAGPAHFQVGEPWWWVGPDRRPCLYDAAATAAYLAETGLAAPVITDVALPTTAAGRAYLDWCGGRLGAATLALAAAAQPATTYLLFYAPQVLRADAPDLIRANLPAAWTRPAFDVLQLEDYEFVTTADYAGQARAREAVDDRLGYPLHEQHYLSGFATEAPHWPLIAEAAAAARARGVAEVFVWAWPQVARDGFTAFEIEGGETMPVFHDVSFPLELGFGASGGPEFATLISTSATGREQRNSGWADARLRYDAGVGVRSEADLRALLDFFRARRGAAHAFRFRDPIDFSSGTGGPFDQALGEGDGVATRFALVKHHGEAPDRQTRRITRPVAASVRVAVDGVEQPGGWSLDEGGWIDFIVAPATGAAVTAGFVFDVAMRFAEDRLEVSLAGWRAGEVPSAPLVEVRED